MRLRSRLVRQQSRQQGRLPTAWIGRLPMSVTDVVARSGGDTHRRHLRHMLQRNLADTLTWMGLWSCRMCEMV